MRCDEIKEHMVEFVYDEGAVAQAAADVREHFRTCAACRQELKELQGARKHLRLWKDEAPLRSVALAKRTQSARSHNARRYLAYAAIAAMLVISVLALANTHIRFDKEGFSFSTSLFAPKNPGREYYTKEETRNLLKQALDDTESRMNETTYLMMHKMYDTLEQERWMYSSLSQRRAAQNKN